MKRIFGNNLPVSHETSFGEPTNPIDRLRLESFKRIEDKSDKEETLNLEATRRPIQYFEEQLKFNYPLEDSCFKVMLEIRDAIKIFEYLKNRPNSESVFWMFLLKEEYLPEQTILTIGCPLFFKHRGDSSVYKAEGEDLKDLGIILSGLTDEDYEKLQVRCHSHSPGVPPFWSSKGEENDEAEIKRHSHKDFLIWIVFSLDLKNKKLRYNCRIEFSTKEKPGNIRDYGYSVSNVPIEVFGAIDEQSEIDKIKEEMRVLAKETWLGKVRTLKYENYENYEDNFNYDDNYYRKFERE